MIDENCEKINGVLFIIAGVAYIMFALGSLDGRTAHLVAGGAVGLVGLGTVFHDQMHAITGMPIKKGR